ncbi:MAG: BamA/TamA family outer membrane protein [Myxococcales bacterium]|nr:BamA/TamA family outer membrane protein [Myxococcales bacterium]
MTRDAAQTSRAWRWLFASLVHVVWLGAPSWAHAEPAPQPEHDRGPPTQPGGNREPADSTKNDRVDDAQESATPRTTRAPRRARRQDDLHEPITGEPPRPHHPGDFHHHSPSILPEWFVAADLRTPRPVPPDGELVSTRLSEKKVHSFLPLPVVRAEPLVGFQLGARLAYAYRPDDQLKVLATLSARVSLRNVHMYGMNFVLWDLLNRNERFLFNLNFRYDPVFPYFGLDQRQSVEEITKDGEERIYSQVTTVDARLQYQQPIAAYGPGTLRALFGFNYAFDNIRGYPDTLLVREQLEHVGDTHRLPLHTGLNWDSRDNVYSPRAGGLHDVIFAAAPPLGRRDAWGLIGVSFRWYRTLGLDEIILATRIAAEGLYGDAPFVPLGQLFGFPSPDAYGGSTIGRGYLRRRYIGRFKGLWSTELRFEPVELSLLKGKRTLALGFKGSLELGRVLQDSEPIFADIHVSGGPGLYVVWDRFAVVRFDVGISDEFVGFYLLTGHSF